MRTHDVVKQLKTDYQYCNRLGAREMQEAHAKYHLHSSCQSKDLEVYREFMDTMQ